VFVVQRQADLNYSCVTAVLMPLTILPSAEPIDMEPECFCPPMVVVPCVPVRWGSNLLPPVVRVAGGSVSGTAGSDEAEGGGACGDGVAAPVLTAGMTAAANGADGVDAAAVTVDDWGAPVGAS